MATVSLKSWCSILDQATPVSYTAPHPWICEVNRQGKRAFEVLSTSQYNEFFKQYSGWDSSCRKLSLEEIAVFSKQLMSRNVFLFGIGNRDQSPKAAMHTAIAKTVSCGDMFSREIQDKIQAELNSLLAEAAFLQPITTGLDKMSKRALHKRTVAKTQSLWGRIKWYFWSWFHDKTTAIKQIVVTIPTPDDVCKEACKAIQDRIVMNMDAFEELVGIEKKDRVCVYLEDNVMKKFPTPTSVKQLWVKQYHPDKYPVSVTEKRTADFVNKANEFRNRVNGMLVIWKFLIDYQGQQKQEQVPQEHKTSSEPLLLA